MALPLTLCLTLLCPALGGQSPQVADSKLDARKALVHPLAAVDLFLGEPVASKCIGFWFDPGSGDPVALHHVQPILDAAGSDGTASFDEAYGLWPNPFVYGSDRFEFELGGVPIADPAWAAWDWTFVVAGRSTGELPADTAVLTRSRIELTPEMQLTLAFLAESGEVARCPVQAVALPDPESEQFWIRLRAPELPANARVLGAPVFDDAGGVVGVVSRREDSGLLAQPIAEFDGPVPAWAPAWKHELGTTVRGLDANADGSRLVLIGDAIEVIQRDGMQLLARIDPLEIAEQLAQDEKLPFEFTASITPDGNTLFVHWAEHVHAISLESLGEGAFELQLGPQLMTEQLRSWSFHTWAMNALGDGTVLLWDTYERPLRLGPRGGFELPGSYESQVVYLPEAGVLVDALPNNFSLYDVLEGVRLSSVLPLEPVNVGFGALSPRGDRLAVSDSFEGWIDILDTRAGDESVSPDITLLHGHAELAGIRFHGEDRLLTIGHDWFFDEDNTEVQLNGSLSALDLVSGEEVARSGEFRGGLVGWRLLPDGTALVVSNEGEFAGFDTRVLDLQNE